MAITTSVLPSCMTTAGPIPMVPVVVATMRRTITPRAIVRFCRMMRLVCRARPIAYALGRCRRSSALRRQSRELRQCRPHPSRCPPWRWPAPARRHAIASHRNGLVTRAQRLDRLRLVLRQQVGAHIIHPDPWPIAFATSSLSPVSITMGWRPSRRNAVVSASRVGRSWSANAKHPQLASTMLTHDRAVCPRPTARHGLPPRPLVTPMQAASSCDRLARTR